MSPSTTLLITFATTLVTALSTLTAVLLTQRSARLVQRQQAQAAAALDRERREHEANETRQAREHEARMDQWQARAQAYVEFLTRADQMSLVAIGEPNIADTRATIDAFTAASHRVMILAPENTVRASVLVDTYARDVATSLGEKRTQAAKKLQEARVYFLHSARSDLGIQGDLLQVLHVRKGLPESMQSPVESTAG
jgi:hypothetical protein